MDRIRWWEVGDLPLESVESALAKIRGEVLRLRAELGC
jgi:hypothetical protein